MEDNLANAIFEDNVNLVNSIVRDGVDLNFVDNLGKTPLMHAVEFENTRLVELFISLGANINKAGSEGFTALHHAVDISIDGTIQSGGMQGEEPLSIISLLIENGADVSATTDKGETPLDIATIYKSKKVMEFLNAAKP